ncbi:MAG: DUF2239 family protein [Erythrobacter sp.]|nr:DUF2239 family protein [Erythrobacter sp.]
MPITAFLKQERIAQGSPAQVAAALRAVAPPERASDLLAFDDETGRQVDLDLRPQAEPAPRRGRPALGVEAKEVTLLPRHWQWLADHGGASATLRKLVEAEMKKGRSARDNQDAAYRFLSVMAGDLPKFEDALRELYAGNRVGYDHFTHGWPAAIRDHGRALAFPA